jgi:hypothetical protein
MDRSGFQNLAFATLKSLLGNGSAIRARGETLMLCGPKGSEVQSTSRCSVCGRRAELVELPGRTEKYCLPCSADVATSILLTTEIDAATLAGRDAEPLFAEFAALSARMLLRSQSA